MSVLTESVQFDKYHGTGNDFLVVDAGESIPSRPAFAVAHCDRETGVLASDHVGESADVATDHTADDLDSRRGADGVLFLALERGYNPARVVMTLVQPDGSVAAMCGNGARVAARWAHDRTGGTAFMIDTPAGTRRAVVRDDETITVEMGVPSFEPRDVPLARESPLVDEPVAGLSVTAVDTGVPHAVAVVDDVDDVDLDEVAPPVRHADVFPEGANVTLASRAGDRQFRQRTFERGVEGETRSCGTGAVAVGAVARRLDLIDGDDPVTVSPPGGDLEIGVPEGGAATLTGPVAYEYSGELEAAPET